MKNIHRRDINTRYILVESGDINAPQLKIGSKIKIMQKIKSKDKTKLSIYPNSIVTIKKIGKELLDVETFDGDIASILLTTKYKVVKE